MAKVFTSLLQLGQNSASSEGNESFIFHTSLCVPLVRGKHDVAKAILRGEIRSFLEKEETFKIRDDP